MTRYSKPKYDEHTESDSDDDQPPPAKPRTMPKYSKPKYDEYTESDSDDDQPPPANPQFRDLSAGHWVPRDHAGADSDGGSSDPAGAGAASDGAGGFLELERLAKITMERSIKLMAVQEQKSKVKSLHKIITAMIINSTLKEDLHFQTIRDSLSELNTAADSLKRHIKDLQEFDKLKSRESTEFYRFSQPGNVVELLDPTRGEEDSEAVTFSRPGKVLDWDTEVAIKFLKSRITYWKGRCKIQYSEEPEIVDGLSDDELKKHQAKIEAAKLRLHNEIETFKLAKETLYEANRLMTLADSLVTKRVAY